LTSAALYRITLDIGLEEREVNDKDVCISGGGVRNSNEVDVVLGQRHGRIVSGSSEIRIANLIPGQRSAICHDFCAHVKERQLATIQSVENVGIVIKNSYERLGVRTSRADRLLRPALAGDIVDVDGGSIRLVTVQNIDRVVELGKVTCCLSSIEWWATRGSNVRGGYRRSIPGRLGTQ